MLIMREICRTNEFMLEIISRLRYTSNVIICWLCILKQCFFFFYNIHRELLWKIQPMRNGLWWTHRWSSESKAQQINWANAKRWKSRFWGMDGTQIVFWNITICTLTLLQIHWKCQQAINLIDKGEFIQLYPFHETIHRFGAWQHSNKPDRSIWRRIWWCYLCIISARWFINVWLASGWNIKRTPRECMNEHWVFQSI